LGAAVLGDHPVDFRVVLVTRLAAWLRDAAHVESLWVLLLPFVWLVSGFGVIHLLAR
jgi:hypothetical protein